MPKAPVELDLYDENSDNIKHLSRVVVPWGILKKAVRLYKRIGKDAEEISEDSIDEMAGLVIEVFGEAQVSREELDKYADLGDMINLIKTLVTRGHGLIPNAPPAA
jgi:hypothetical protein